MLRRNPNVRSFRLRVAQPRGTHYYLAADTSSVAASYSLATRVVADARGDSPREVDPSLVVESECELDEMADSRKLE